MLGVNCIVIYGNNLNYKKSSLVIDSSRNILKFKVGGEEMDIYNIETKKITQYMKKFLAICKKPYKSYKDFSGKVNADQ